MTRGDPAAAHVALCFPAHDASLQTALLALPRLNCTRLEAGGWKLGAMLLALPRLNCTLPRADTAGPR